MEYGIAAAPSIIELTNSVNGLIKKGWRLHGELIVITVDGPTGTAPYRFIREMVRRDSLVNRIRRLRK